MVDAHQAQSIVLRHCEGGQRILTSERFVIQSCELSPRGDYWVVRANSEDYVLHGRFERCYVGVNAFLVNISTGVIETVGSGQSYEQYLQDKYDVIAAGERKYVMTPSFDRTNKMELIHLRQEIGCSLQSALRLLAPEHCMWFTGRLRLLVRAKDMFKTHGIETQVDLQPGSSNAVEMKEDMWYWDAICGVLSKRANLLS